MLSPARFCTTKTHSGLRLIHHLVDDGKKRRWNSESERFQWRVVRKCGQLPARADKPSSEAADGQCLARGARFLHVVTAAPVDYL